MRIRQINFKVSDDERKSLNKLLLQKGSNMSDLIREALKRFYSLEGFEASYSDTAKKSYNDKWRLY